MTKITRQQTYRVEQDHAQAVLGRHELTAFDILEFLQGISDNHLKEGRMRIFQDTSNKLFKIEIEVDQ